MSFPIAALPASPTAGIAIEEVANKTKDITHDKSGALAPLSLCMSDLNDIQLMQIPVEMVRGGGYADSIPFGMGTEIAADFISNAERDTSRAEASPHEVRPWRCATGLRVSASLLATPMLSTLLLFDRVAVVLSLVLALFRLGSSAAGRATGEGKRAEPGFPRKAELLNALKELRESSAQPRARLDRLDGSATGGGSSREKSSAGSSAGSAGLRSPGKSRGDLADALSGPVFLCWDRSDIRKSKDVDSPAWHLD